MTNSTDPRKPQRPRDHVQKILSAVKSGSLSPADAALELQRGEVRHLDSFAVLDTGRRTRKGVPEIIYSTGKIPEQVARICSVLLETEERVLVSGATDEVEHEVRSSLPDVPVRRAGRMVIVGSGEPKESGGRIVALSGGTSDLPVLEEAVAVAREMGATVEVFNDVGVAGLHRLMAVRAELEAADVVIVVAGMDGALASAVGGLVSKPVIAVPTSVGYGAAFEGLAALLTMLNSCAPGVVVVNIDNGFGAAAFAAKVLGRRD